MISYNYVQNLFLLIATMRVNQTRKIWVLQCALYISRSCFFEHLTKNTQYFAPEAKHECRSWMLSFTIVTILLCVSSWYTLLWRHNGANASQITSFTVVGSTVYSGADQRKHKSSASLAFVRGISPETGEFPAQRVSNAENVSIWWRHYGWPRYIEIL